MPELPEVETMVRDLRPHVLHRTVAAVDIHFPGSVVYPGIDLFTSRLIGQQVTEVGRRGKYASFALYSNDILIIHRGMTGSLLRRRPEDPPETHLRLTLRLDDDTELRFNDQRKFGKVYLMRGDGTERALPWADMGPEPLNGSFTPDALSQSLRDRTGLLKPLLLNQRLVAGLGNIYVDEALFLAGIHPRRPAGTLDGGEVTRLHAAIQEVLEAAVEGRGTTFDSYMDIEGRAGQYQGHLKVFARTGQPCPRCAWPIEKIVVGGRGTHFCPACQKV